MKTKAAVVWEQGQDWQIEELELDPPKEHEVLIRFVASGLCHSDEHVRNGDLAGRYPIVGGHEGAGIIEAVGPSVSRVKPGDHVVCAFIPSCGHCRWCSTGHQSLCDLGASILVGSMLDGTFRFHGRGQDLGAMCLLGTFSQYAVIPEYSCVKIDDDIPLSVAALVGCGVTTGWGSSVYGAEASVGETMVVYGIGGIGINAVQGARLAGCEYVVAVDPLANKREWAKEFGATHVAANGEEAQQIITDLTWGVGADKAIITMGVVESDVVTSAFNAVRKGGTVVLTGLSALDAPTIQLPGAILTLYEKRVIGSLFGSANPQYDIAHILNLYKAGQIKLEELITHRYTLDEVNQGYHDMLEGHNIRGIIEYQS
ncbi:MAG: NDMA-dependent alcohol dehydrogenase [Firmicutes bacterium]|nr:NDMA-dependent alcohol dehydrogenase [Bacillota bacterium]